MISNTEIKNDQEKLSDFIEAAAHDLHAPLRKLSVLIDRTFDKRIDPADEEAKKYMERIDSCIAEMQSLIDGLTGLALAGEDTVIFTSCDLNVLVRQTVEMMKDEIEGKHAEIMIDTLPVVQGNPIQFKQLFKNLLENAIKFSKKNEPLKIEILAEPATEEEKTLFHFPIKRKYYKITMLDNGIGFNPAFSKKIFEPFVRLHSKSEYRGNGLGLSICNKIVVNHNGVIYAEGNERNGSRFTLILPETPNSTLNAKR